MILFYNYLIIMDKIIKIQKWFRGCIVRLKILPLHQPKRKMRQDYLFLYKDLVYIKYINLL